MALSQQQQRIAQSNKRFRCVVAGRRGGKTFLGIRELCRFASQPRQMVWFLTNSRQQSKALVWHKLKRKLRQLHWLDSSNETELTLSLRNGSKICLKSAEQGENLRGESLNFCVIDEFCDIDLERIWATIVRPSLSDQLGHAMLIGTPKAGNQYARDLFDRHLSDPNWASFSYTTLEGGFVSEEEVAQARRDLAPKIFRQEYEASWEYLGNLIFDEFGDHNIQSVERPRESEPIIIGLDFNVSIMTAQVGRKTQQGLEYFDEIVLRDTNTQEMADEIRLRYPKNPITVYPDASGSARKTSAGGATDHNILYNRQLKVSANPSNPTVRDRINCANSLFFQRSDGTTRFRIDPRCQHTIKSFRNWTYKENSVGLPDKESGWDHACDSASYPIAYLYPILRNTEPRPAQRWGHQIV